MSNITGNLTTPRGTPCQLYVPSTEEQALKTLAYLLIMLLSLVGNLFVVLIVYKHRSMRTTVNFLIVNMALSDLMQSSIAIPKRIVEIYALGPRWFIDGVAGELTCKFVPFLQDISTAVSIQSLVVIAFDRFFVVMFPLRKATMISTRAHSIVIGVTWLIPMAFHAPYFFTFRLAHLNSQTYCIYSWEPLRDAAAHKLNYFLGGSIALFFFPLVVLVILYTAIFVNLSRRKIPGNESFRNRRRVAKRNRNVLRMVVTVVVVFGICWLPVNLFGYLFMFRWSPPNAAPCSIGDFMFWALFLAYSNAACNPFIYFIFSENYRKGFKAIFSSNGLPTLQNSAITRRRHLFDGTGETSGTDTRDGMSLKSIRSLSHSSSRGTNFCIPNYKK